MTYLFLFLALNLSSGKTPTPQINTDAVAEKIYHEFYFPKTERTQRSSTLLDFTKFEQGSIKTESEKLLKRVEQLLPLLKKNDPWKKKLITIKNKLKEKIETEKQVESLEDALLILDRINNAGPFSGGWILKHYTRLYENISQADKKLLLLPTPHELEKDIRSSQKEKLKKIEELKEQESFTPADSVTPAQ